VSEAQVVRRPQARTGTAPPVAAAPEMQPPAPLPGAGLAAPGWTGPALTLGVQRKPVLGRPGDAYEVEADAVAGRVAGGLDAPAIGVSRLGTGGPAAPPAPAVQSKEDDDPDAPVQMKEDDEEPSGAVQMAMDPKFGTSGSPPPEEESHAASCSCGGTCAKCRAVQRAAADGAAPTASMQATAASAVRSPGPGAPLPGGTRGTLESRMGVDLGGVRVHDGADAQNSAERMHARAFTHGRDIWVGRGESASDTRLMAHEVTHVLQQDGVVRRKPKKREDEPASPPPAPPAAPGPIPAAPSAGPIAGAAGPAAGAVAGPIPMPALPPVAAGGAAPKPAAAAKPPAPKKPEVKPPPPIVLPEVKPAAPAAKPVGGGLKGVAKPALPIAGPALAPAAKPSAAEKKSGAASGAPAAKSAATAAAPAEKSAPTGEPGAKASAAKSPAARAGGPAPSPAAPAAEPAAPAARPAGPAAASGAAPAVSMPALPAAAAAPVAVPVAGAKGAAAAPAAGGAKGEGKPGAEGGAKGAGAEGAAAEGAAGEGGKKAAPVELLMPPPPEGLSGTERARLHKVDEKAGTAVEATTDLPAAEEQVGEARGAVEEPKEETDAKAGDALVEALGARPAPSPEIEALCVQIRDIIYAKRPPDEDSLVEAKPAEMAKDAGGELNESVEGDAERVQGQYDQLQTPPEGSPELQPEEMGEPPGPAETPRLGAAGATPDGVPAEDVSLDADVEASQQRMADAGMESEPAKLVEDGPIADARAAQGELVETAVRDPQEVLAEQAGVLANAQADMAGLQAAALASLKSGRAETTTEGRTQQSGMVGSEEQMRKKAGDDAQAIFTDAQTRVNTLLQPLPKTAMAKWDAGVKLLSTKFEQKLAKVKKWVDERHESTALAVWDYFTGLPDWVTEEYDAAELAFGNGVCDLIREISTEVNGVIATAEAIIDESRTKIDAVFAALPEGLQTWAAEQQAAFGKRLDGLAEKAAKTRSDFTRDLTQKASQAVDDVRQKIHELREAAKGLIGRIADAVNAFLDDPVKFIINGLLRLVGIAPSAFWALVNKIGEAIDQIADDPLGFAGNLLDALGQGFTQFFDNIGTHLLNGLMEWLFSGLGSVGVEIPADLSIKSIITFFLQLMGLSWANIRKIIAKHVGDENLALIEKAWELVSSLIEMGPEGLFELIKEQLDPASLLTMVLEAATEYLVEALIKAVTPRILLMFNPVGAILQAIEAIFRVLQWIFENAAKIFSLVETIVNGVTDLIAGNIGGMANAIEKGLAKLIPPVIDFLASYLGLGGLPEAIADVIKGFQEQVLGIVDKVVGFLVTKAKGLMKALSGGADEEKPAEKKAGEEENWTEVKGEFEEEGHDHDVTFDGKNLKVASEVPKTLETLVAEREARTDVPPLTDEQKAKIKQALAIRNELVTLTADHGKAQAVPNPTPDPTFNERVRGKLQTVANLLAEADLLAGEGPLPATHVVFTMSGGRSSTLLAEPLTKIPGNTNAEEAGDRKTMAGIDLISRWEQKSSHTRTNLPNPVLSSPVTGTHVLASAFHGPWQTWNVAPSESTLNNRMTQKPEKEAKKAFGASRLRYEVRVEYFNNTPPPGEAYTLQQAEVETVKAWLGYYIVHKLHVKVSKWTGKDYDEVLYNDNVQADMPPVVGEPIKSLRERVLEQVHGNLTGKEYVQDPGTPDEIVWLESKWSVDALREELAEDRNDLTNELRELRTAKILYTRMGRGARLHLNKKEKT
jgi:hypothetical protein